MFEPIDGVRFVALERWPGEPTQERRRSQFKSTYSKTVQLLMRELDLLDAEHVLIQLDADPSQFRLNGMPRADARARGPGIILTFESMRGPLSYPCDTFDRWQDNLRAIALSLQALRAVDRYGVTKRGEQYTGSRRLTYRGDSQFENPEQAAEYLSGLRFVQFHATELLADSEAVETAWKRSKVKYHPDVAETGLDTVGWSTLTAAFEIIRGYHERTAA